MILKLFCLVCLWVCLSDGPILTSALQASAKPTRRSETTPFGRVESKNAANNENTAAKQWRSQIRAYLDTTQRLWTINAEALEDIENDLQAFVNCAEEGDIFLLDSKRLRLSQQVILQRNITISGSVESTEPVNGVFPVASSKTVIRCPRGNQGAFLLQAPSALLANLEFRGCSLDADAAPSAIIGTEECDSDELTGTLQLHHVTFRENTLHAARGISMTQPSCSALEMIDVDFMDNECTEGVCGAFLSTRNTLRNVLVEDNQLFSSADESAVMFYGPPDSVTTAESITATGNSGVVIFVEEGELELSDSTFTSNTASTGEQSSCLYLQDSTATIRDTIFERNIGLLGAALVAFGSEITSSGCSWIGNSGSTGGAIYLADESTATLRRSTFAENSASGDGGGIYTASSSLTGVQLMFENNTAVINGAGFYCGTRSSLEMRRSTFSGNRAQFGAATEFEDSSTALFRNCIFTNNAADVSGGVSYVENSEAVFGTCTFSSSNASFGGALYSFTANVTVTDSTFEDGYAVDNGGAVFARTGSFLSIQGSTLSRNTAVSLGGALYVNVSDAEISDSILERNRAREDGGGIYGGGSRIQITETSFIRNRAPFGGAIEIEEGSTLQASDCSFRRNRAQTTGGVAYTEDSVARFERCGISQNEAAFAGGIYAIRGRLRVSHSDCRDNSCTQRGGCLFGTEGASLTLQNMTLARNRAADYGGGLYLDAFAEASISDSVFDGNTAGTNGGGFYASQSTVEANDTSFAQNGALFGGATEFEDSSVAAFSNCSFRANSVVTSGGVSYIEESNVAFNLCNFSQNSALFGGALHAFSSDVVVSDSECRDNAAQNSGGCIHASQATNLAVVTATLVGNFGEEYGGGIFANGSTGVDVTVRDSTFLQNRAGINGGGLYGWETTQMDISNCSFTENRAEFGAALEFEFHSATTVRQCTFTDNVAAVSGGALYDEESNFAIFDSSCSGNRAQHGGDFYVLDSRFDAENVDSVSAVGIIAGGFVYALEGSFAVLTNVSVTEAESPHGGAVYLTGSHLWGRDLHFTRCNAGLYGGALFANESSSALCFNCHFEQNRAVDCGGAVYLESQNSQLLAFQFDRCAFISNFAQLGGALCFQSPPSEMNCSLPDASCTFLALTASDFVRNRAAIGAGAILASQPTAVRFSCEQIRKRNALDYWTREQFEDMEVLVNADAQCPEWRSNTAGQYGDVFGSQASVVRKTILSESDREGFEIPGNSYRVQDLQSGSPLPTIDLELVDAYGQGPVVPLDDRPIVATMSSPDQFFCWPIEITMMNGVGTFSGVTGFRQEGVYEVRIDFSESDLAPLVLEVHVAGCSIGQVKAAVGNLCQPCSDSTYNFLPNLTKPGCVPCPDDALCGNSAIRPKNGFWHQTPCSPHIQECLTERACNQPGRDAALAAYGTNLSSCLFDEQTVRAYMADQCREGYMGVLCGSCASEFGRSRSFRCEPCYGGFGNFILVLLTFFILLGLSGFAIRSNLTTLRGGELARGHPRLAQSHRLPEERMEAEPVVLAEMEMMERYALGEVCEEEPPPRPPAQNQGGTAAIRMELEKWRAVEIFKIGVNYLQVISVAISLNVDWTDALIGMFEASEFLGGVTSEAAVRSVDCLISHDSSIARSAVHTAVGILVPVVAMFFYAVFWALAMFRFAESLAYLAKRCLLSCMAVSYLTYIAITKTAVNVHYCVDVYDSLEFQSDSDAEYWAVDTSLRCYEGTHTVLAAVIGWPVLVLFSAGFPIGVFYVLFMQRRHDNLSSAWLFQTAGFLYRSYRREFVFWESFIMLRKAVLAVVVVFAYPLGGNLQGVLAVFVLTIALYFQIICRPFRKEFDALNELEGLSLLVSSLTFVAGLFFNDDHANDATRALLSVFVIVCNLGLLTFLCVSFIRSSAKYLRRVLDAEQIPYDIDGGTLHILRIYLKNRLGQLHAAVYSWLVKGGDSGKPVNPK